MPTTDEVEGKALAVANKALDGVSSMMEAAGTITGKLTELAESHGQLVVDVALNVARVSAAQGVVTTFFQLLFSWIMLYIFNALRQNCRKAEAEHTGRGRFDPDGYHMGMALSLGLTFIGLVVSLSYFNLWDFVGIVYPELWIAQSILKL